MLARERTAPRPQRRAAFTQEDISRGAAVVARSATRVLALILLLATAWSTTGADLRAQTVSGQVVDVTGSALPGVNVVVKGTTIGTATGTEGNYELEVPNAQEDTLSFSYIGFSTQEVPVDGRSQINVTLQEDTGQLDEVVVVGYGELGREEVTSAIGRVSGADLEEAPVATPTQALQGRVSGVTVAGGAPGEEPQVRIRGLTTPNNNSPLYVVDGVPVSDLVGINSNNIESVEVLKDASAAAIYGSRAAGGVVLITTKQGNGGAEGIQTSFNSYIGLQQPWRKLDLLNTAQYVQAWSAISGEAAPPFEEIDTSQDYDYQDEVLRTAPIMNYDLAFSGGTETSQYRVSLGYLDQEGIITGSGYKNYTLGINTNFDVGDRIRIGESLTLQHSNREVVEANLGGGRSILEHTVKFAPYIAPYDESNPGGYNGPNQIDQNDAENPLRIQNLGDNYVNETRIIGNVHGEIDLFESLYFRSVLGTEAYFGNDYLFTPSYRDGEYHANEDADISEVRATYFAPITTNTLNYNDTFGDHTVSGVGGIEVQWSNYRSAGVEGENTLSNNLRVAGAAATNTLALGSETRDVLLSYFGRVNYNYDDRYLLQASLRRDGYTRFGPNNKIGYFPAFSAGWNVAGESFMEDRGFDILKLRGSWGVVGNNNAVGAYEIQSTVSTNYTYVGADGTLLPAATIPGLANQALRWETTQMANVGLDLGIFGRALTLSAEYYNNTTDDVLLTVQLPGSFGFIVDPRFNTAEVRTDGFEFSLGYLGESGDLAWDLSANFGTARNEVLSLGLGSAIPGASYGGAGHSSITRVTEGEPLYHFYGFEIDRLYQESDFTDGQLNEGLPQPSGGVTVAPGDVKFRDVNEDNLITDADRTNIGEPVPSYTYGLNARLDWKNFDLSAFFQGAGGHQIYRAWAYWTEGMTRVFNAEETVLDRWTPENPDTSFPRAANAQYNTQPSERWVEDGDYLRLKQLTLGYEVPPSLTGLRRLRVYLQSQNLLTFTGYDGYDPEVGVWSDDPGAFTSTYGIDYGQTPQARAFTFGVQLGV